MFDPSLDTNQVGDNTITSPTVSGNVLSPQRKYDMMTYANQLMSPSSGPPATSWGSGLAEMIRSGMGGYMANQANQGIPGSRAPFSNPFSSFSNPFSSNTPMQLPSANGGGLGSPNLLSSNPTAAGAPMQLSSANGGDNTSPMNIFSGLFRTG